MNTQQQDSSALTRTSAKSGIKRRLSIGIVAVAAFASLAMPGAGSAAGNDSLAGDGSVKLPPHVCYNDAIGTYYCYKIKILFPEW